MKKKVVILYGGKSVEHDISIITALQTMMFLPKKYDYLPVYIDRDGVWWHADNMKESKIYQNFSKLAKNPRQVSVLIGTDILLIKKKQKFVFFAQVLSVLNCCHGHTGEDGCVQGLFELCDIPQTSPDLTASAICMDKCFVKDILEKHNIKTPAYFYFDDKAIDTLKIKRLTSKLGYPVVVKPANLGSSIGISVCKNEDELSSAIELAFNFDKKILIEKKIENLREFNCACLSFKKNLFSSQVNEVLGKGEIYSFEDKYISKKGADKKIDKKLEKKIQKLTEKVYALLGLRGVVRIDFLFDEKHEELFVNEINTIPGSLAFYLFKNIPFSELINCIIEDSLDRKKEEKNLIKTFESDALKIFSNINLTTKK